MVFLYNFDIYNITVFEISKFILYTSLICLLFLFHRKVTTIIPKVVITFSIVFLVYFYLHNPLVYKYTFDTLGKRSVTVVIKTMEGFTQPITEVYFYHDKCPIGVLNDGVFLEKSKGQKIITTKEDNKIEYKIGDNFILCEDILTGGLSLKLE
ncbi:MAG: hypothetical protein RR437_02460 [Clostridium sp.]